MGVTRNLGLYGDNGKQNGPQDRGAFMHGIGSFDDPMPVKV